MNRLTSYTLGFLMMVTAMAAGAAEEFTLWTSETFAAPYIDGKITSSAVFSNNSGLASLEVVIVYEALSPDRDAGEPADFRVNAIVEQQIGTNWYPIAYQLKHINKLSEAPKRIIVLSPGIFESVDNFLYVGSHNIAQQSFNPGKLGDKFRVRLVVDNSGISPLTSVTLSGYGRKYD